jgi:hypothetical protein
VSASPTPTHRSALRRGPTRAKTAVAAADPAASANQPSSICLTRHSGLALSRVAAAADPQGACHPAPAVRSGGTSFRAGPRPARATLPNWRPVCRSARTACTHSPDPTQPTAFTPPEVTTLQQHRAQPPEFGPSRAQRRLIAAFRLAVALVGSASTGSGLRSRREAVIPGRQRYWRPSGRSSSASMS